MTGSMSFVEAKSVHTGRNRVEKVPECTAGHLFLSVFVLYGSCVVWVTIYHGCIFGDCPFSDKLPKKKILEQPVLSCIYPAFHQCFILCRDIVGCVDGDSESTGAVWSHSS